MATNGKALILYATMTGNTEKIATWFKESFKHYNFDVTMFKMVTNANWEGMQEKLYFDDYPPFNMPVENSESKFTGYSTEIVEELFKRAKLEYNFRFRTWKNAFFNAKTFEHSAVFSTVRSANREKHFKWVGPLITNYMTFYSYKDIK